MSAEDKFNLEHMEQYNRYFNQDAIQKAIQEHVKKAGLNGSDGVCTSCIKKGLYEKLEQIIDTLITISRSRQRWRDLHPSNQSLTVSMMRNNRKRWRVYYHVWRERGRRLQRSRLMFWWRRVARRSSSYCRDWVRRAPEDGRDYPQTILCPVSPGLASYKYI